MNKLEIIPTTKYKKDLVKVIKQGYDKTILIKVINALANKEQLDSKYRDHALYGEYKGCRECHLAPDWLLIYRINNEMLELILTRTGSHSNLFNK